MYHTLQIDLTHTKEYKGQLEEREMHITIFTTDKEYMVVLAECSPYRELITCYKAESKDVPPFPTEKNHLYEQVFMDGWCKTIKKWLDHNNYLHYGQKFSELLLNEHFAPYKWR